MGHEMGHDPPRGELSSPAPIDPGPATRSPTGDPARGGREDARTPSLALAAPGYAPTPRSSCRSATTRPAGRRRPPRALAGRRGRRAPRRRAFHSGRRRTARRGSRRAMPYSTPGQTGRLPRAPGTWRWRGVPRTTTHARREDNPGRERRTPTLALAAIGIGVRDDGAQTASKPRGLGLVRRTGGAFRPPTRARSGGYLAHAHKFSMTADAVVAEYPRAVGYPPGAGDWPRCAGEGSPP